MGVMRVLPADPCLSDGGEMGALMRGHDWGNSPLGPPEGWSDALKISVSICLNSRFPILLWWGPDLVMLYNDAYRPILGASKHPQALGRAGIEMWPEIWHIIRPQLWPVMECGEASWAEDTLLVLDRNGYLEEAYFTYSYSPIRRPDGTVGGVFTAVTETTGRVIGERRLRFLRDRTVSMAECKNPQDVCARFADTIGDNSPDLAFAAVYLRDPDQARVRLSCTAGIAHDDPRLPGKIDLMEDDDWGVGQALRGGAPVVLDRSRSALGSLPGGAWPEPATATMALPIARAGREAGTAGVLVAGISPRRRLDQGYGSFLGLVAGHLATALDTARVHEEDHRRAEALAELDRAKTAFFSNVSHEFRTPLALMLGPLEDALAVHPDAPAAQVLPSVALAHRNSRRLLKLVNALLDFSRVEAGRRQAHFVPVALGAVAAELASRFRSAVESAGLQLTVMAEPLGQPVYVDAEAIETVILNLLSNALKFTLQGGITLDVRADDDGTGVCLTVRDTGIGVPQHELPRLFERFHRVEGNRGRSFEGSGIGLALVQELVKLHRGSITAESELDRGTAFTVRLPFGVAHLPANQVALVPANPVQHARPTCSSRRRWAGSGTSRQSRLATPISRRARPKRCPRPAARSCSPTTMPTCGIT